jgi:hypothetical protein
VGIFCTHRARKGHFNQGKRKKEKGKSEEKEKISGNCIVIGYILLLPFSFLLFTFFFRLSPYVSAASACVSGGGRI